MKSSTFQKFSFPSYVEKAIELLRFKSPTPIQETIIPLVLRGESIIGQSQTGTGKTHAFLLPIFHHLTEEEEVQAVIITPTRELARQIYQQALFIAEQKQTGKMIRIGCYMGGTEKSSSKKNPHIVIGTPTRIRELISEKKFMVHKAKTLVLDEADLTFDMGFLEDVDQIASKMPKNLQILVFSATIPQSLLPFFKKYLELPKIIQVEPQQRTAINITHWLIPLRNRSISSLVHSILKATNPYIAIVFANTKKRAIELADELDQLGHRVGRMHGDLEPRQRKKMLKQIQTGDFQVVVASDLAARGMDFEGVTHVINAEIPKDLSYYVHRVGRTGRADQAGVAISIVRPEDERKIQGLEKMKIAYTMGDIKDNELKEIRNPRERKEKAVQSKKMVRNQKQIKGKSNMEKSPNSKKPSTDSKKNTFAKQPFPKGPKSGVKPSFKGAPQKMFNRGKRG